MQISQLPIDPRRAVVAKPAVEKTAAETILAQKPEIGKKAGQAAAGQLTGDVVTATEEPRYKEQQRAAKQMLTNIGQDAKLAGIMLNPIFAPHANAIAWQATGRAIFRYETEVPRRELGELMAEEQGKARQEIMALPQRYYEATGQIIDTTGTAIVEGARVTGEAIETGVRATGNAMVTGAKAVGTAFAAGAAAVFGGLMAVSKGLLQGLGSGLSGLGNFLQNAGSQLEGAGK